MDPQAAAPHATAHFFASVALVGAALALMLVVRSGAMRKRLRLAAAIAAASALVHAAVTWVPQLHAFAPSAGPVENLLLTLAAIHAAVTLLFNPWFQDRVPDRAPGIVQDALVIGAFFLVATLAFHEQLLAMSAVGAVVAGLALQDTLGNFFAGLALQIDRPFRPGHWISVGAFEGLVTQVTWRATKIRTKAGNLVIVPNNIVAKEAINNYSEPAGPTRLSVDVGTGYEVPPNRVRAAVMAAMTRVPLVLRVPAPDVIVHEFGPSSVNHRARFWIQDYAYDAEARDQVTAAIYYELRRQDIEIPWPIQIQYQREEPKRGSPEIRQAVTRRLAAVPVLASLPADAHEALAAAATETLYANGEVIVREGESGASLFVVASGRVAVTVGEDQREVAVTDAGGYFGEMSLLTGAPRSATVIARGDCTLLEIGAEAFRQYVHAHPDALDQMATAAETRRQALVATRDAPGSAPPAEAASLLRRMKHFFGL